MEAIAVESWSQLATIPVAVAIALATVQFVKVFAALGAAWWRRISALAAVTVIVGATVVGGGDPLALALAVVNGMIAGVAASKTFDVGRAVVQPTIDRGEADGSGTGAAG